MVLIWWDELAGIEELRVRVEAIVKAGAAFGLRDLAIKGSDVMDKLGMPPGRDVGRVLERLLERVLDDPALNERDTLLGLAEEVARELHA